MDNESSLPYEMTTPPDISEVQMSSNKLEDVQGCCNQKQFQISGSQPQLNAAESSSDIEGLVQNTISSNRYSVKPPVGEVLDQNYDIPVVPTNALSISAASKAMPSLLSLHLRQLNSKSPYLRSRLLSTPTERGNHKDKATTITPIQSTLLAARSAHRNQQSSTANYLPFPTIMITPTSPVRGMNEVGSLQMTELNSLINRNASIKRNSEILTCGGGSISSEKIVGQVTTNNPTTTTTTTTPFECKNSQQFLSQQGQSQIKANQLHSRQILPSKRIIFINTAAINPPTYQGLLQEKNLSPSRKLSNSRLIPTSNRPFSALSLNLSLVESDEGSIHSQFKSLNSQRILRTETKEKDSEGELENREAHQTTLISIDSPNRINSDSFSAQSSSNSPGRRARYISPSKSKVNLIYLSNQTIIPPFGQIGQSRLSTPLKRNTVYQLKNLVHAQQEIKLAKRKEIFPQKQGTEGNTSNSCNSSLLFPQENTFNQILSIPFEQNCRPATTNIYSTTSVTGNNPSQIEYPRNLDVFFAKLARRTSSRERPSASATAASLESKGKRSINNESLIVGSKTNIHLKSASRSNTPTNQGGILIPSFISAQAIALPSTVHGTREHSSGSKEENILDQQQYSVHKVKQNYQPIKISSTFKASFSKQSQNNGESHNSRNQSPERNNANSNSNLANSLITIATISDEVNRTQQNQPIQPQSLFRVDFPTKRDKIQQLKLSQSHLLSSNIHPQEEKYRFTTQRTSHTEGEDETILVNLAGSSSGAIFSSQTSNVLNDSDCVFRFSKSNFKKKNPTSKPKIFKFK